MSSIYRILCLTHDPALTLDREYRTPGDAETAIAAGITDHPHCDLAIGRYSYPLVEAGCPASRHQPADLACRHGDTVWTDSDVLRLLVAGCLSQDAAVQTAVKRGFHCWPWERLRRLREELQLVITEGTDTP